MSKRKIILIDEEKCNGCGQCVDACAEGALQIVDGVAKLVKDSFCDGLGACIGDCPEDALTIVERDADEFDEEAALEHVAKTKKPSGEKSDIAQRFSGCPGSALRSFAPPTGENQDEGGKPGPIGPSLLGQWPVQLMLVPPQAPFLKGADLLICADCVPFALRGFHELYLKDHALLVGCPKLDDLDHYREKLAAIFAEARPASVTVLRMEVPCCGGISFAVEEARDRSLPELPIQVHTIGVRGDLLTKEIVEPKTAAYAKEA